MTEYKISELVPMKENGEIEIPELQRAFVWSDNQVKELAESIYKSYPTGLITLYKLSPRMSTEYGSRNETYWVLDGQQRLLSLVLIFRGKVEAIWRGRPQRRLNIWFDPKKEKFEIRSSRRSENWVKLSEIFGINNRRELERYLRSKNMSPEEQEKVSTLWSVFRGDYKVLVHELSEELDIDDLGNIFVRTNFAGTRVRGSDVYSTIIAITRPELIKELRDFCNKLPIDIDYGILIRTFAAFLTEGKVKLASKVLDQAERLKKEMGKRESQIETIVENVKKRTEEAIRLLREEMGIKSSSNRYLPTENVLPVMAYYINKKGELLSSEKEGLLKWFVLVSYFRRYSSSSETRLNEDLSIIEKGGGYNDLIKKLEEREGNLKERIKDDISNGRWSELLLYAILKQNEVKDFLTHDDLQTNNLSVHHIFPEERLRGTEYEEMWNDIGNITLITPNTNSSLSSELPENYLRRIPPKIRDAHLIPSNQELWKLEKYNDFVEERKERLSDVIEKFLE